MVQDLIALRRAMGKTARTIRLDRTGNLLASAADPPMAAAAVAFTPMGLRSFENGPTYMPAERKRHGRKHRGT